MNLKELHSFKLSDAVTFHDKLNPKLWNSTKLRPDVRDQLMLIAEDFLEELGVHDLDVKDITISGSNAAYSYTKHSDLDLHILVDMGNLPVDEVYRELFLAKKTIYNDTHDIKIHTIPVELYVQDSRQPVVSLGEYSVMNDKWLKIPSKRRSNFDQTSTKSKYEKLLSLIEIALKSKQYSKVKHIIDTIKRYRQAGLDKGGEFGPENLAYKMLRSQGYITKLFDLRDKLHSEKLSFETMYQNIDEELEHIPTVLYHATYKQRLKNIKLTGLGAGKKRNWPDSRPGVVYLALDPHVAESYAETALDDLDADWDIVILQVSTNGLDSNKFHLDSNVQDNEGDTVEYHGIIPPSNISLYKQGVAEGRNNESPDHLVSEFLKSISPKELRYYTIRDNCGPAALHMKDWAEGKGIDLTRHEGYFVADTVVYDKADFTKEMKREFIEQGLDFNDPTARKQFIESNPKYSEEWKKIPHYWLQDKQGNIYDPTGYIQFVKTGLSSDLDKSRYKPIRQGVNENEKEKFNNELWKPGLDFKQDINGILYHVTNAGKKNDFLSIKAYDKRNPNPIGDAQFAKARNLYTGEVQGVTSMKTKVDPKYQGQGIAANMYALIRMLGVNILPSETQTNAGQKMWSKWRKQGDVNSLKDLDPKVKGVAESENNDTAISLSKLGKFHPGTDELAEFVPERATAHYALHPDKWESTFYSLTNKDSDKLKYYGPKKISIPPGTLVGDMAIANKFYRAKTSEEKQQYAEAYKASLQSYPVDVSQYRMPELLIPRQNVGEEYNTMQFAAEKTPAINPYGGLKDNQFRGGISEASGKKISFNVQKGNGKFSTTLIVNNTPAGIYQYDSNTGRSIAEVYPEFKGKGLGKLLVLHAIYTAAKLGLDFQEDESRTSAYDNVLDSLSSNGYIVDDDGYWYVTGDGEQYLKQALNEASGYIPSEKQKNDPRFKTALTVDVHPDTIKKNAKAFYWNTSRAGIPPTAKANGKIS
jgi:GNAT superfamily N-acetyltransferase/predicted GNAT family acetyltransferase